MFQKVDDKYHWLLAEDEAPDGEQVQTYCEKTVAIKQADQVDYVWSGSGEGCEFCNGVANIIHTAAYEAIRYSVPKITSISVLKRALEFTNSSTLTKAITTRIRKLEKAAAGAE